MFGPGFGLAVLLGMMSKDAEDDKVGCGCLIAAAVVVGVLTLCGAYVVLHWVLTHVHVTWGCLG
jgi:hypothetical protein